MFRGAHNTAVSGSTMTQVWGNQTNIIHNYHLDNPPRGIVRNVDDGPLSYLPLEQVHIDVLVVDVSARISLRETFTNASEFAMGHAKYVFPVPARAAVCAFEMQFADGHVITGVSKEKAQAAKEHKDAMRAGKATGLLDWVTDDMFIISVGSIPAKETVTTNLIFVMDLMDDELKDEVRLQLPMSVGSRYGLEPAALATANSVSNQKPLSVTVDIQMSGVIRRVTSPTHPNIMVTPFAEAGHTSHRRTTVTFHSPTFLTQSFVLTVHADGLDAPRCFAERDPGGSGTVAMQLTFIPNFKLPPISAQEYLFLVDRSGSMAGPSIQIVKQALLMLLRMLPEEQTMFNIFSFGDEVDGLWRKSQPYHQSCVDLGTTHINGMTANYGGTELCAALEFVCHNRRPQISTMVFLLTDGMIHAGDQVISAVATAVAHSSPDAPLRVFALGIGHEVSSAVVEGVARAGNGISLFAVENENIENKCAKLLRAGRFPCVENVTIDWGIPESSHNPTDTPFSVHLPNSVHVQIGPPPSIQQSPNRIQNIFPGMRFTVFSLTTQNSIPRQVVVEGKFKGGDGQIVVVVPVSTVEVFNTKRPDISLIHTLSARHLITDLVERRATLPIAINPVPAEDIRKAAIVQLGVKYQLASRYTSFIAVYETNAPHHPSRDSQIIDNHLRHGDESKELEEIPADDRQTRLPDAELISSPESGSPYLAPTPADGHQAIDFAPTFSIDDIAGPNTDKGSPEYWILSTEDGFRRNDWDMGKDPLLGLGSHSFGIDEDDEYCIDEDLGYCIDGGLGYSSDEYDGCIRDIDFAWSQPSFASLLGQLERSPVPIQVINLVQLQNVDGSFSLSQSLGEIVGKSALQKPADVHADDVAWATALAVAFLRTHLDNGHLDVLEGILDKVSEFIEKRSSSTTFDALVQRAMALI